jgi:glycosyltransferase involved in cell wall biosynthesis
VFYEQNKSLVSIGLPVYNAGQYLEEALDSILAQTFEDFELIISDNGSTDNTEAICWSYARRDQRIRYFRNETNLGAAWNFNRVFELASGKYFKWTARRSICADLFGVWSRF